MSKKPIWIGMVAGSLFGGWVVTLFGAGTISIASIIGSVVGGIGGIYAGYQISRRFF